MGRGRGARRGGFLRNTLSGNSIMESDSRVFIIKIFYFKIISPTGCLRFPVRMALGENANVVYFCSLGLHRGMWPGAGAGRDEGGVLFLSLFLFSFRL